LVVHGNYTCDIEAEKTSSLLKGFDIKPLILTEDLGKVKHFKWLGENAAINFELWMDGTNIVRFKFNDFITQPVWVNKAILTENLLKFSI
jgi:hypothetical protein